MLRYLQEICLFNIQYYTTPVLRPSWLACIALLPAAMPASVAFFLFFLPSFLPPALPPPAASPDTPISYNLFSDWWPLEYQVKLIEKKKYFFTFLSSLPAAAQPTSVEAFLTYVLHKVYVKTSDERVTKVYKHLSKERMKRMTGVTSWLKKRTFSICKFGLSKKREKLKKSFARFNVNGLLTPWSLFRDRDYTCTDCCEVLSLDSQSYINRKLC